MVQPQSPLPTDLFALELQRQRLRRQAFLAGLFAPAWATLGLILLTVWVWRWQVTIGASHSAFELARAGARIPHLVSEGEWWRLFSAPFLHTSFNHLASNGLALLVTGWLAERAFGWRRFLLIAMATAVGGGVVGVQVDPRMSVGISGMVFGIWAADVAFAHRYWYALPPRFRVLTGWVLGGLLLYFMAQGLLSPGTDNAAHLGGAIVGLLMGSKTKSPALEPRHSGAARGLRWALAGVLMCALLTLAAIARTRAAPLDRTVPRMEGPLVTRILPEAGLRLDPPASWLLIQDGGASMTLKSPISGVRLLVSQGPIMPPDQVEDAINPLHHIEGTLLRAAGAQGVLLDPLRPRIIHRNVGGDAARELRLDGPKGKPHSRAILVAVWLSEVRRVFLFTYIVDGTLPEQYDALLDEVLASVVWIQPRDASAP